MKYFLFNAIGWILGLTILYGFWTAIQTLQKEENELREKQRAACVASGGKYAESQTADARPHLDYCIK